jgi:hypothetical protein
LVNLGWPLPSTTWASSGLLWPKPHTTNKIKAIMLKRYHRAMFRAPVVNGWQRPREGFKTMLISNQSQFFSKKEL